MTAKKKKKSSIVRIILPLFLGVIVGGLGVAVFLFEQKGEVDLLRQQILMKDQQITELMDREQALAQKVSELEGVRAQLRTEVTTMRDELTAAKTELARAQEDLTQAQDRYNRLLANQERLDSEMTYLKAERDAAESSATEAEMSHQELKENVTLLRNRLAMLDREYRKLSDEKQQNSQVARPNVLVVGDSRDSKFNSAYSTVADSQKQTFTPDWSTKQPTAQQQLAVHMPQIMVPREQDLQKELVKGQLVSVNPAERFVVLDKGLEDGVSVGMHFDVIRGNTAVGKLRVVRVRDSLSACDIVTADAAQILITGDVAVQTGI